MQMARDSKVDWLISFDNDIFMRSGTPLDVIAESSDKKGVIGLTYGLETQPGFIACAAGGSTIDGRFAEVPYVGGGVLMVHRKVWEKIPRGPWFRMQLGNDESLDPDNRRTNRGSMVLPSRSAKWFSCVDPS